MDPLLALLIIVVCAYTFGEFAKHLGVPSVVGQLVAGIIIGIPVVRQYVITAKNGELISFLADLGILLLFFFVGLQIDLYEFKRNLGTSVLISLFNTTIPLILGFVVFRFILGSTIVSAVIVGLCLSFSSQSVSIAVLEELNMLNKKIGRQIITAGAVDDIIELVILSVVFAMIHVSTVNASISRTFLDLAIFVASIFIFRFLILPLLLHLFAEDKSITHLFTGAVVVTLIMAVITVFLGLGAIVGALFAGIMVREILLKGKNKNPWEEHNIAKAIHIVSFGFLVPVFFAWVGINTEISAIIGEWKIVLLLIGIAIFGNLLGSIIGMVAHGGSLKEGFVVGWGLIPKGDIELVVATIALSQGIITKSLFSALIMMALVTTIISPVVFRYLVKRYHMEPAALQQNRF